MNAIQTIERAALDAYRLNWTWDRFWQMHADAVREAEPINRGRYRRLVRRLLALVVSGDTDGQQVIDDTMPWEADEQPCPSDTETAARIDWAAAGIAQQVDEGGRGVKSLVSIRL